MTSPPRDRLHKSNDYGISFLVRSHCFVERVGIVRASNATLAVSNATLFGLVKRKQPVCHC